MFRRPDSTKLGPEVVDVLRAAKPQEAFGPVVDDDSDGASDRLAAWLGTDAPDRAGLAGLVARAKPQLWPARISAELETFERSQRGARTLTGRDLAVLLATDTVDGLLAAL